MVKERILHFIENQHLTKESFFKEVGVTSANFRGVNLKSALSTDVVVRILSIYPDLSAEWLLTGNGEMLKEEGEMGSNGKEEETEREQIERLSKEVGVWQTRYEELKKKRAPEAEDAGCAGAAV